MILMDGCQLICEVSYDICQDLRSSRIAVHSPIIDAAKEPLIRDDKNYAALSNVDVLLDIGCINSLLSRLLLPPQPVTNQS